MKAVMPAETKNGNYVFAKVPKDVLAYLVAIKYEDGKPFLAINEITTASKNYDLNFNLYTLESLKEKLKILD